MKEGSPEQDPGPNFYPRSAASNSLGDWAGGSLVFLIREAGDDLVRSLPALVPGPS